MKQHPFESKIISPSKFIINKESHAISKPKPKIRIIHIIAPEIIKTDVENFRELVQRLTGKSSGSKKAALRDLKSSEILPSKASASRKPSKNVLESAMNAQRMKKESEEMYQVEDNENPSSYLNFLQGDVEGFMMNNVLEFNPFRSSHQISSTTFGDMPLCQLKYMYK